MFRSWSQIFAHRKNEYTFLDSNTISKLKTLTFKHFIYDRARIERIMKERSIFFTVQSQKYRDLILIRFLEIERRILFFYTFFQNAIYFETCSKILRVLLSRDFDDSMTNAFYRSFIEINQTIRKIKIQVTKDNTRLEQRNRSY